MTEIGATVLERQADHQLISELYPQLRRFAAVVGPWDLDPDDLLHAVLVRVLPAHSLHTMDNPGAYVRRAIVNQVKSELRKRRTQRLTVDLLKHTDHREAQPDYPSDLSELMSLRPVERAVLYLHDIEGHPFDEVATMIGITAGNARVTASRARQKLKDRFSQEDYV